MTTISQLAVVETLSVLGLTPHHMINKWSGRIGIAPIVFFDLLWTHLKYLFDICQILQI